MPHQTPYSRREFPACNQRIGSVTLNLLRKELFIGQKPGEAQTHYHPLRWVAFSVFVLSSTLNYLDRFLLNQLAPLILAEMHFSKTTFGWMLSVASIAYAGSSLLAGWLLDRLGVNRAISLAVGWWSLAGIGTGLVRSLPGLFVCRAALAVGESAGVPSVGKVNGMYLRPREYAMGTAANQVGLSLGLALAPVWTAIALAHSWRLPFIITGVISLLWIPVWLEVNRRIPPQTSQGREQADRQQRSSFALLRDKSLLLLVVANVLWMGGYSFWSNWTTFYLMGVYRLELQTANNYSWIPPLFSNFGGFFGGWLSMRWIQRKLAPVPARKRAVWVGALGALTTVLLPVTSDVRVATAMISVSFFFLLAGSVNIYALPIDLFGAGRAGLAISALTCAFGILQTVISPAIGYLADRRLYNQAVWMVTIPLLLSALILSRLDQSSIRSSENDFGREL